MKKSTKLIAILLALAFIFAGADVFAQAKAKFHIGVVTGTVSQSEDDLRGAEALIKAYGSVKAGGMIQHITYPDDFMSQQETFISSVVALADDPLMKAIVINQAIPGTTEAFKRVREKNKDILLLAGEPHEDPLVIQSAADLALSADFVSRGYTIIWAAKQLGAKTFVHISFPRHMSYESLGRRRAIMEEACNDLGIKFAFETAPDPTSDVGVAGAQQFILEKVPQWIEKYGKETAFFCTNDAHTEPLLKQLFAYGGLFVEADLPSPLMGYPGALGLDLSKEAGDFPAILKSEAAVVAKGCWASWHLGFPMAIPHRRPGRVARTWSKARPKTSLNDVFEATAKYTPGAKWNGAYYLDVGTGVRARNQVLIYMDTYVFGKGFLPTTKQKVPEKYFTIKMKN